MSADFKPTPEDYKEMGSFKVWCQKTLPLVYDDSLSYYELLCKVVNYINVMIENIEAEEINIAMLNVAYNDLEDYVNNYFDSLDVISEINAKLNEMASDGTLTRLIQPLFDAYKGNLDDVFREWLDEHPEATTTVEDHSIGEIKLTRPLFTEFDELKEDVSNFGEYVDNYSIKKSDVEYGTIQYSTGGVSPGQRAITTPYLKVKKGGTITINTLSEFTDGTHVSEPKWRVIGFTEPRADAQKFNTYGGWGTLNPININNQTEYVRISIFCGDSDIDMHIAYNDDDLNVTLNDDIFIPNKYVTKEEFDKPITSEKIADGAITNQKINGVSTYSVTANVNHGTTSGPNLYLPTDVKDKDITFFLYVTPNDTLYKSSDMRIWYTDGTSEMSKIGVWKKLSKKTNRVQIPLTSFAVDSSGLVVGGVSELIVNAGGISTEKISDESITIRKLSSDIQEKLNSVITGTSVLDFNNNVGSVIKNLKHRLRNTSFVEQDKQLVLLMFSDIHADSENLERIIEFKNHYSNYIDDVVHAGDSLYDHWTNGFEFWNSVSGANKILNCIGNHDVNFKDDSGASVTVTQNDVYNRYFKPYVNEWNVVQPNNAESNGLMYYYKDYADQRIRLIVLDCMSYNLSQKSWFENILSDANTRGYGVIVMQHYPMKLVAFDRCSFTSYELEEYKTEINSARDSVQTFIDNGGEFICWIAGHTHKDFCGVLDGYDKQVMFVHSLSSMNHTGWCDAVRIHGEKSQDCFSLLSVDRYKKVLRIVRIGNEWNRYAQHKGTVTIDYANGRLVDCY